MRYAAIGVSVIALLFSVFTRFADRDDAQDVHLLDIDKRLTVVETLQRLVGPPPTNPDM